MNLKNIDVIWLFEHVARELDVACAVKAVAKCKYNIDVEIFNIYKDIKNYLVHYNPKIVVHPFVYFVKGAIGTEEIFQRWPDAIHVNAAWEQIHYKAQYTIKSPADDIAKNHVIHIGWGEFYKEYLQNYNTKLENIIVNGHPAYQLYNTPYKKVFLDRAVLAQKYNLDLGKRWIFIPENYRWAFAEKKIPMFAKMGGDLEELKKLVEFSKPSLVALLKGCYELSKDDSVEVIFRPRPAVNSELILNFYKENIGNDFGNIKFNKEMSIREWIMASDIVISSYSTSLLESSYIGKPSFMFAPIDIPSGLHCEWYDYIPVVTSSEQFKAICLSNELPEPSLKAIKWVNENLMASGDSIENFAKYLFELSKNKPQRSLGTLPKNFLGKDFFNKESHEMDFIDSKFIDDLTLKYVMEIFAEEAIVYRGNVINKSMDRKDLLDHEAMALSSKLNDLIKNIYLKGIAPSSWVGTIPKKPIKTKKLSFTKKIQALFANVFIPYEIEASEKKALNQGDIQRLNYIPLENSEDDLRYPWFLYWEIYWTYSHMKPLLNKDMRIMDAGGASSLFTCFLASEGYELHSVDLNQKLLDNGDKIAKKMQWNNMHSYCMDLRKLDFEDNYFDHAFSICVFEHLDYDVKISALAEISRCLKPGGILALTFDYRNPAPGVVGVGKDPSDRNALKNANDIHRNFLATRHFELIGNKEFVEVDENYLQHPMFDNKPYTFGAIFLRNIKN